MATRKLKDVFTTGDVGRICRVSYRTAAKWFDTGLLKGFVIPGGQDRRVPRESLEEFMAANKMPLWWLETYEL